MKINKSNEMELVGKVIVNNKGQKANVIEFKNEKYVVEVEGKQKEYAIASLKRNWEIEEEIVENDNKEDVLTEEQLKDWKSILLENKIGEKEAANAFYRQSEGEDISKEIGFYKKSLRDFKAKYQFSPILVYEWRQS